MAHGHSFFLWRFQRRALPSSGEEDIELERWDRWEEWCSDWELGFKPSGLDHTVRILHHLLVHIFSAPMLFTHAPVPSAFRLEVSVMIQEYSSKFFPTVLGIHQSRHATHRALLTGGWKSE